MLRDDVKQPADDNTWTDSTVRQDALSLLQDVFTPEFLPVGLSATACVSLGFSVNVSSPCSRINNTSMTTDGQHTVTCLRLSEVSTQQTLVLVLVLCLLSVTLCSWSKVHFPSSSSQQSAEQNLEVRSGSLLQSGGSAGVKTNQLFNPTSYKVVSDLCPHWYLDQSRTWWDWRFGSAPDWRLWAAPNYPEQNRCFTSIYPTGDEGPVSGDSWWAAASHVGFNVPSHEHWWFISRWSAAALGSPRSRETNMLNSFCPSLTHSRGPLWREPMRPQRVSSTVNKVKWKRNDVWILRRELRNIRLTRTAGGVCPPSRHWKRTFSSSQLTVAAKHGSVTPELWLGQTWS